MLPLMTTFPLHGFLQDNVDSAMDTNLDLWNSALLEVLLPELPAERANMPVLLACDDEAVRRAADVMEVQSTDPDRDLGLVVRLAVRANEGQGIRGVLDLKIRWDNRPRPRPGPDFFAVLCLAVLAASRMGPSEASSTSAYYKRFRRLLGLPEAGGNPGSFDLIPYLFDALADWMRIDERGRRGLLLVPKHPHPPWVGHCIEQTVFREADRRVLSEFFSEGRFRRRGQRLDHLLLLRRWSGRSRLTKHAQSLVADERHTTRVRAAIASALQSWDGSVLESAGGRSYELRLRLGPRPLAIYGSVASPSEINFTFRGITYSLSPGQEIRLPWDLLDRGGAVLGESKSRGGGVRVPWLGETIVFELVAEEGLRRVVNPNEDEVWVLTRDLAAQRNLREWLLSSDLPYPWQAYHDVPTNQVPGVEIATVDEEEAQVALADGLEVQEGFYLSDHGPHLQVGDIGEGERLEVLVNGKAFASASSQMRIELPAEAGRTYAVEIPSLDFKQVYHASPTGAREGYGSLSYHPADPAALRTGASPTRESDQSRISGAAVYPKLCPALPIMRRRPHDVTAILADGSSREWAQPPLPLWLATVGYEDPARWEIPGDGVVWLLCWADNEVTRWLRAAIEELSLPAAEAIAELGLNAMVYDRTGNRDDAKVEWQRLVNRARK